MDEWTPGIKHPETPRLPFMNCHEQDRVRKILPGRCSICGYVISRDEKAIREIFCSCGNPECACALAKSALSHAVCELCNDMYRALYVNYGLKNINYFKNLDEKQKRDFEDKKKRWGDTV
jgi:hypothetical protein